MKRIILMMLRNILILPVYWIKLCYYASHIDKYTDEYINKFLKKIVKSANKGGNVEIISSGAENIPEENGFIFYPNHQGMYDMLAIIDACDKPVSAVAKIEVSKVQGLKQVMACLKGYYMDRDDVRQSMKVIMDVTKEVKEGRNYIIFAEGTRSKKGNQLLDFKGGSFKAATKAKCPIIPVAMLDSFKPFDTGTIDPVKVQVHFLEPLLYEEYKDMNTNEIAKEVKSRIEEAIKKYEEK
ncbi:MAG: lysophospholipid acyltransferase family protein [bacterium]|nr:lysophospholipid acyltransferase family protein [bacterium]